MIVDLISNFSQWKVIQHDDGWTLQNVYNKKYLDIDIPAYENGVRVVAVETSNPRKWDIQHDGEFDGWR